MCTSIIKLIQSASEAKEASVTDNVKKTNRRLISATNTGMSRVIIQAVPESSQFCAGNGWQSAIRWRADIRRPVHGSEMYWSISEGETGTRQESGQEDK